VLACRRREVAGLCGLQRQDNLYSIPEWEVRSRFSTFVELAECALRLLPSQRPLALEAERRLFTSSPFIWRTHGAGVFRLPGLRRRWREDLVDLLSPSATGLVLRQAVNVQVFWSLTLSREPRHAHLRRAFYRAKATCSIFLNVAAFGLYLCWIAVLAEGWPSVLSRFPYIPVAILLAQLDAEQVWMCAGPRLARAAALAARTDLDFFSFELYYPAVLFFGIEPSVYNYKLPAWFWPALGAVALGRVLVVVGCALLWVQSARYFGRPLQRRARAFDEDQLAGVELGGERVSLLERAV
jgi:hypothetical protein